jgi:hypothetical protein
MQAVPFIHETGTDPGKERLLEIPQDHPFFLKKYYLITPFFRGHPVAFQGTILL